jgi:predicted RNA binding protein YcfA (HicA-like mRNA interferase family)
VSERLPVVKGRDVVRALQKAGFLVDHIQGSHHILIHKDDPERMVSVPVHAGKDIKKGTLRAIIKQAGLTVQGFRKLL